MSVVGVPAEGVGARVTGEGARQVATTGEGEEKQGRQEADHAALRRRLWCLVQRVAGDEGRGGIEGHPPLGCYEVEGASEGVDACLGWHAGGEGP